MHASARPYVIAGSAALLTSGMIAVMPAEQPAALRVANMDVRLVDSGSLLTDLTGALGNLDPLTSLGSLSLPDLGSLDLGGLDSSSLFADGSLLNIPYNLFADIVNIPYNESLALQEYAYALGPASLADGSSLGGGVPGWIPPGFEGFAGYGAPGSSDILYNFGGTGSWYTETLGNTWGWDDGNFPQLDGLISALLPFPSFTQPLVDQIQTFAQAEFIAGADVNCEFECASPLGYLGEWLHGATPLASLLAGTTFPDTIQGGIGDPTLPVIWAGEPAQLNLLAPFEGLANSLTESPSADPILLPDLGSVSTNLTSLFSDFSNDFNPFITGSFVYWGAPTLYSIPAAIGGTIQDLTGIPNQFGFPADQIQGAEPIWGPTAGPSSLLTGLPQGFEYLLNGPGGAGGDGLLGYLNPETYLTAIENLLHGNFPAILGDIPLLGYLGLGDPGTLLGSLDPSALLGSVDPSALGSLDPSAIVGDLSALLPNAGTDLASQLPDLTTNLSALLPNIGTDLASLLGPDLATNLSALLPNIGTDLASSLGPDLATNLLTVF
jgi:hypothetical protein